MANAEHTPGPWKADNYGVWANFGYESKQIARCPMKASVNDAGPEGSEAIANARLIAAAPDLLKALSDLLIVAGEGSAKGRAIDLLEPKYVAAARSAIAKARGQQ